MEKPPAYAGNMTGVVDGEPKSRYELGFKVEHNCAGLNNTVSFLEIKRELISFQIEDTIPFRNYSLSPVRYTLPTSIFILQFSKEVKNKQ